MSGELYIKQNWARVRALGSNGKKVVLHLVQGDLLPSNLLEGELERLQRAKAVGPKVTITVARTPEGGSASLEAAAGKETVVELDLETLADYGDEELAAGIQKLGVKKLVEAVKSDGQLAARVLAAENAATGADPRSTLVKEMDKIIEAAAGK